MQLMQYNYNLIFWLATIFAVLNCCFTDYLETGMWEKLDKIKNPELKIKAARFNAAYADGSLLKYKVAWHRWVEWIQNYSEFINGRSIFSLCLF